MRRWARMHYVPSDQRKETWNPIVLDEMRMKDQEMHEAEENSMNARVSSMYVPLAPGVTSRIDEAHEEASTPHILKMQDPSTRYLRKQATELTEE
ncbi:hypothetical protein [uncultured Gimesia sp.]|uniref:hypothetical protein n=1 Tax=uncultured Gimesia sp. TaxID=1678688 RepID=UPI0030D9AB66